MDRFALPWVPRRMDRLHAADLEVTLMPLIGHYGVGLSR